MGVAAMLCTPPCKKDGKKVVSYLHVGGQMEQATYRDVSLVKDIHTYTYIPSNFACMARVRFGLGGNHG